MENTLELVVNDNCSLILRIWSCLQDAFYSLRIFNAQSQVSKTNHSYRDPVYRGQLYSTCL